MEYSAKNGDKFDEQEIADYYSTFIERYQEIDDWQRYIKQIERGEERIRKKKDTRDALIEKVKKYDNPYIQLKINYFSSKNTMSRSWTELEDRFLICMLEKVGYEKSTVYEEIKRSIRIAPQFRFDWFIKSRTSTEIGKRCQFLLNLVEREYREAKYPQKEAPGKRKADEAGMSNKGPSSKSLKKSVKT